MKKPIKNIYCVDNGELVIPWKCGCCIKCWLFTNGIRKNQCPCGGPFSGFKNLNDKLKE